MSWLDFLKGNGLLSVSNSRNLRVSLTNKNKCLLKSAKESFILDGTAASYKKTLQLKNELEEAYAAYNIPSVKFDYTPDYSKTVLPSAPDLSSLESRINIQSSEIELPDLPATIPVIQLPSKIIEEEDIVELVDIPSRIID